MKLKFLKEVFCIMIIICVLLTLFGCNSKEALPLNDIVINLLAENSIENSKITALCVKTNDIAALYDYKSVDITDEALNEYVKYMLLSHENMIQITDRNIVQKGDAIIVSYVVRYNSEIVANAHNEPLMVGSGNYGEEFENAVIGAVVGEPFECELSSPIDTGKYKKGDALQYNITVESINYFEAYTSSDQYILDYYGAQTEEEFLAECKIRLKQIKQFENKNSADNEFLDKIAEKCKFYIDKEEAAVYSEQIVKHHKDLAYISGLELNEYIKQTLKMTEDEFYDYCYDEGVKEIKRYLLVGASVENISFDGENFAKFCSMNGYDKTRENDMQARYAFLKRIAVSSYRTNVKTAVSAVAYKVPFENNKSYSVELYDSSNVYTIDFSTNKGYKLSKELQEEFITAVNHTSFGETPYLTANHLYQMVLVFKDESKVFAKVMVDEINGYVKWQQNDGQIVCAELKENLRELIERAKQG